ncbi:hypothetical protein EB796_018522 [Bugula neritina]|uniref:Uncharacterized protein n=1 Tax=Bugula neritina TaxID=10212 RepID=A0A7J7JAD4_BUGNE|nr:hypothetical protein EB796_018522 [Bugula neritina]
MKHINQKQTLATTIKEQLTALCSWKFFLFWVSNSLFGFGSAIVFVFIPDYAEQKGLSYQQAVYILSTLGLCNAIGRLLNILLSLCRCNHGNIYIISCTLSGICICLMNLDVSGSSNSFLALAITCSSYGLFYGIQLANVATVTSILSPQPFLNTAFGLTNLAAGVGTICGSPAAAFFFSIGGDRFELTYYIAGGATMLAGLILLPTICLKTPVSQVCDETE